MVAHDRVDHGGRLVIEDALRLRRQCSRDRHRAPITGGKIAWILVARIPEAHHVQQTIHHIFFVLGVVIFAQFE